MSAWLLWRLVKWVALLALGYGVAGSVLGVGADRRRAGLATLPIALLVVFVAGFGMLEARGLKFAEPWVLASLAGGVASASGAALHATTDRSRFGAGLAVGGVLAAVGFMVFRDVGMVGGLVLGALGVGIGAGLATQDPGPADPEAIRAWFRWIGRAEGVTLLFLFGVAMPAKYALGHPELIAWTGWLHGVMFTLYVGALVVGVLRLGWSTVDATIGLFASLVPFGTFLFERRVGV